MAHSARHRHEKHYSKNTEAPKIETEKKVDFISALLPGLKSNKNPNDHRGKLEKGGQFHVDLKTTSNQESFTNRVGKQVKATKPELPQQELDAAIKLGRFVTVRKRLKAIAGKRRRVQKYIREILVFLVFLFVFINRNSSSDEDGFFSADRMAETFCEPLDFGEIVTVAHMWAWMEGTMCDGFYGQTTFDGIENPDRDRWLLGTWRKVGGLRIGTLRVKKKSCGISTSLFNKTDNAKLICYGYGDKNLWDESVEAVESYGFDNSSLFHWTGWNGTDAAARRSEFLTTQTTYPNTQQYSSPAFAFVLPQTDKKQALSSLHFAKNNRYVDFHTRMVIADMTLMNGQTQKLMTLRFMFAMTKAGGVVPTFEFMQVETEAIDFITTSFSDMDSASVYMLLEIVFYVYFYIQMILKMSMDMCTPADPEEDPDVSCWKSHLCYRPLHYFQYLARELPDLFQTLNLLFYAVHWVLRLMARSVSPREITFDTDSYIPIRSYSETLAYKRYAMVLVIFCVFFRFVFYLSIIPELGVITSALTKSVRAVAGFMGVFVFFVVMFLMAGIQLFGTKMEQFRNLVSAFWTIFEMAMLGENLVSDMLAADRSPITYVYVGLFYVLNTIMLLNMAIAIISDAYAEARADLDAGKDQDVKIGHEIKRYFMLKIWKIPFLGPHLKDQFINYGDRKKKNIRRALSGQFKVSLSQQMKIQQEKVDADRRKATSQQESGDGDFEHSKYALSVEHQTRIAKTAAQQTLKELRQLSIHLQSLSEFVHTRIDSVGGGGGGGGHHESVEDFLFAHKKKNEPTFGFGAATPSFVVDGVGGQKNAVVVDIGESVKEMTADEKKKKKEHGVL